jgi:hypothetical protein
MIDFDNSFDWGRDPSKLRGASSHEELASLKSLTMSASSAFKTKDSTVTATVASDRHLEDRDRDAGAGLSWVSMFIDNQPPERGSVRTIETYPELINSVARYIFPDPTTSVRAGERALDEREDPIVSSSRSSDIDAHQDRPLLPLKRQLDSERTT